MPPMKCEGKYAGFNQVRVGSVTFALCMRVYVLRVPLRAMEWRHFHSSTKAYRIVQSQKHLTHQGKMQDLFAIVLFHICAVSLCVRVMLSK